MCHGSVLEFGRQVLRPSDVEGKMVLEVGSRDINGSLRGHILSLHPARYVGVDIMPGPGVDELCDAVNLVEHFGREAFDLVLSTETLEHVLPWRRVVWNMKHVLKPGGVLLLTTSSRGFPFHEYPGDYWRFEIEDMRHIFSDFHIEVLLADPEAPGVFLKAVKPPCFQPVDLEGYEVHAVSPAE